MNHLVVKFSLFIVYAIGCTLDSERLRVRGRAGGVLCDAGEVGVVARPQVVDPQDGLVAADLADDDAVAARCRCRQHLGVVAEPGEGDGEVAVGDGAEHGDTLPQPQVLPHAELVDGRWDWWMAEGARKGVGGNRISLAIINARDYQ